jgi:LacI family transcriptional regulator
MTKETTTETTHILALGDNSRAVYRDFLKGLLKYSRLHGRGWVLYVNSPRYHPLDLKEVTIENIRHWAVHAVVDYLLNPAKTTEILSTGLPCIAINWSPKQAIGKYIVTSDNAKMGEMAAKHFRDKQFLNFAYYGLAEVGGSQERCQAFTDTITKAGHRVHIYEQPYAQSSYSWETELPYLADWLKTLPKPVGIMAGSDMRAQHVLEACHVAKLHVPEEVAVLGIGNDDFFCELTYPSLTSICLDTESVGYRAAEILDRLMNGEKLPPQKLIVQPTTIAERQSTDVLAINDDEVKRAVRFIRLNSMKPISASDVADIVCTTTRTLDRRFQKSLGRSVHSEIVRTRIEQACHMLATTNLSISQIAHRLGYSEPKHLTQAFKREKGIGPLAYRRTYASI